MTTPEALNALADRVEREKPSRKLDGKIWIASGQINEGHCAAWCRQAGRTDLTRARYIAAWAPQFTTSLDAAMTLVPENWTAWELASSGAKTRFHADLSRFTECDAGEDWAHGRAKTPAAALTAAALRARAADMQARAEDGAPHPSPSGNEGHDQ